MQALLTSLNTLNNSTFITNNTTKRKFKIDKITDNMLHCTATDYDEYYYDNEDFEDLYENELNMLISSEEHLDLLTLDISNFTFN